MLLWILAWPRREPERAIKIGRGSGVVQPAESNPFPPISVRRDINGITYAYLAGIDLIRPNFEVRQLCLPIDRG